MSLATAFAHARAYPWALDVSREILDSNGLVRDL